MGSIRCRKERLNVTPQLRGAAEAYFVGERGDTEVLKDKDGDTPKILRRKLQRYIHIYTLCLPLHNQMHAHDISGQLTSVCTTIVPVILGDAPRY